MGKYIQNGLFFAFLALSGALFSSQQPAEPATENYQFIGRHFLASYHGCDEQALRDIHKLPDVMKLGVAASGATLLDSSVYIFPPDAMTMVLLLSESHASIHTYPEHGACFVDFFTCGTSCSAEQFDEILRAYLKPQKVDQQLFMRE